MTSPANTPGRISRIARMLLAEGLGDDSHVAVAENRCQADEKVHAELRVAEVPTRPFAELNVLLLWRGQQRARPLLFGRADATFE